MSDGFAIELDLQTRRLIGKEFVCSPGRCEYWLQRFFRPMERTDEQEARFRNSALVPVVVEVGQHHPERVGGMLLAGLQDSQWSRPFHIVMLRALLNLYRTVDAVPESWNAAITQSVAQLQATLQEPEKIFLGQVMQWGASPPNAFEKREFK